MGLFQDVGPGLRPVPTQSNGLCPAVGGGEHRCEIRDTSSEIGVAHWSPVPKSESPIKTMSLIRNPQFAIRNP